MELNNIQSTGRWDKISGMLNDNFAKLKLAIETGDPTGPLFNAVSLVGDVTGTGEIKGTTMEISAKIAESWGLNKGYLVATAADKNNWNTAFGWGNHASAGYLKTHQSLAGYATQSWVNSQGFLKTHQSLAAYATQAWATSNFLAKQIIALRGKVSDANDWSLLDSHNSLDKIGYYLINTYPDKNAKATNPMFIYGDDMGHGVYQVIMGNYDTNADGEIFAHTDGKLSLLYREYTISRGEAPIKTWGKWKNYLDGYATQAWVESKKYLTAHQSLAGYATQAWVESKKYLTAHQSLEGYATQSWVNTQGFLKSVTWASVSGKPAWIGSAKPTYTYSEVGAAAVGHNHSGVYEPVFTKNTAFNKNFGTAAGTVAQGNDSRINNGQTAFGWGNHASAGYLKTHQSLSGYATQTWVNSQGFLKTHQSLAGYATQDWTNELVHPHSTVRFDGIVEKAEILAMSVMAKGKVIYVKSAKTFALKADGGDSYYNNWIGAEQYITWNDDGTIACKDKLYLLDDSLYSFNGTDLIPYATQSWVNSQGFLKTHQSLAGYATISWVSANFPTKAGAGASGSWAISITGNAATATTATTANKVAGTLSFAAGAFAVKSYNGSAAVSVNVPTKTSHLTNDSGYLTAASSLAWAKLTGKPTTIAGYGITDAKIANGVITLGANTITPLTSHQSLAGYATLGTDQTITGQKTFSKNVTAPRFISNIGTGTAPFAVSSTTVVPNLNADMLDGYHGSSSSTASTYVLRNSSKYVYLNYINSDTPMNENGVLSQFIGNTGLDHFYRKYSRDYVRAQLNNYTVNRKTLDLTDLDENTYYPCHVELYGAIPTVISIFVNLNSGSKPGWSTHASGFCLNVSWEAFGSGWGASRVQRKILNNEYFFTSANPCGGIEQNTMASHEIVYLRGGAKYYYVLSNDISSIVINKTGYSWKSGGNYSYEAPLIKTPKADPGKCYEAGSMIGVSMVYGSVITTNTTFAFSSTNDNRIVFSRPSANYIIAPTNGYIVLNANGKTGTASSELLVSNNELRSGATNTVTLGTAGQRWSNMYSVLLNVSSNAIISGALTVTGNITASASTVTAKTFVGALTGNATTATTASKLANTLTFAAGAFAAKTFNGSAATTVNVPTHTSHLTNNSGFITSSALTGYATQAWTTAGFLAKKIIALRDSISKANDWSLLDSYNKMDSCGYYLINAYPQDNVAATNPVFMYGDDMGHGMYQVVIGNYGTTDGAISGHYDSKLTILYREYRLDPGGNSAVPIRTWGKWKDYLDGYATQAWVEGKKYLTAHQSLAGYATQSWVTASFPTKTGTGASGLWGISISGNAATATKLGTATVGSATKPIYLNGGTATACGASLAVSVTGNAATATVLATGRTINGTSFNGSANIVTSYWGTARTIKIGDQAISVNGSADVTFSRNNMAAAYGRETAYTGMTVANTWYRIASSRSSIYNLNGTFYITLAASGYHSSYVISAGTSYGQNAFVQQLAGTNYSNSIFTDVRIVTANSYSGNYAYLEVYVTRAISTTFTIKMVGDSEWSLLTSMTAGSIPAGYYSKAISLYGDSIVATNFRGNATTATSASTATKLTTARTIWGQSFNGTANISGDIAGVGTLQAKSRFNEYLATYNGTINATGTICITLPNGFTNAMNIYEIYLYEYVNGMAASVITVAGYNYDSKNWINIGCHTKGYYNKGVRLGYNGSKCVILLGTTTTVWQYPQVFLKSVYNGFSGTAGWNGVYSISLITSETGYTSIVTPAKENEYFGNVYASSFNGSLKGNADTATSATTATTASKVANTLTFAAGAFAAKTFNGSAAVTVNVPTHTSHLTNNSGFLTSASSLAWAKLTGKPTTLAGYGITDGVNAVSVTGSGNAVTSASVSGHTLTLTKGATFLTTHQSLAAYATQAWTKDLVYPNSTVRFDGIVEDAEILAASVTGTGQVIYVKSKKSFALKTSATAYYNNWMGAELYVTGNAGVPGTPYKDKLYLLGDTLYTFYGTDLIPYATQTWVGSRGYLTSASSLAWAKITGRPTTITGYGITDGVTAVSVTGSGNAITAASVSGHTLTLTKGATFLTAHQSLAGYATQSWVNAQGFLKTHQSLAAYATTSYVSSNYLNLTGGTASGDISVVASTGKASSLQKGAITISTLSDTAEDARNQGMTTWSHTDGFCNWASNLRRYRFQMGSVYCEGDFITESAFRSSNVIYGNISKDMPAILGTTVDNTTMYISAGATTITVNPDKPTYGGTVRAVPVTWRWRNGTASGYANFVLGSVVVNDQLGVISGATFQSTISVTGAATFNSQSKFVGGKICTTATNDTGYLVVGNNTGNHLSLDYGRIQSYNNATYNTMYINYYGGNIYLGNSSYTTFINSKTTRATAAVDGASLQVGSAKFVYASTGTKISLTNSAGVLIDFIAKNTSASSSDARLKTGRNYNVDYCERLMSLGRVFDYKYNELAKQINAPGYDELTHTGLLYQDVAGVMPHITNTFHKDYGAIDYRSPDLISLIIGATQMNICGIRGLLEKTENIEDEVLKLKQENKRLQHRVKELENRVN